MKYSPERREAHPAQVAATDNRPLAEVAEKGISDENDRDEKVEERSREAVKQYKRRPCQLELGLKREETAPVENSALLTLR